MFHCAARVKERTVRGLVGVNQRALSTRQSLTDLTAGVKRGGPDTARLWRDVCLLLGLGDSLGSTDSRAHALETAAAAATLPPRWRPSALSPSCQRCSAERVM